MQNNQFEKEVQQKMEELHLIPNDAVWQKVDAGLPKEKKDGRWVLFIFLFTILIIGSMMVFHTFYNSNKNNATAIIFEKEITRQKIISNDEEKTKNNIAVDLQPENNPAAAPIKTRKNTNQNNTITPKIKFSTINFNNNITDGFVKNNITKKTKGFINLKIKTPATFSTDSLIFTNSEKNVTQKITVVDTAIVAQAPSITKTINADTIVIKKGTDSKMVSTNKPKTPKNKPWQYGIAFAFGTSSIKSNLFSNALVYFASPYTSSLSNFQNNALPNNPANSLSFSMGFYAERKILPKWKFKTGLNYLYQSNTLKVGDQVDSTQNLLINLKDLSISNFFRLGNNVNYKNKFHLLELPLLLQYQPSNKSPFYFEAGPSIAYLINSNSLTYYSSTATYFTNKQIFNKLLLSLNVGLGINIFPKSKLPFSIGYQFKYSLNSITKNDFGKEHFVNSLFYLQIRLKK